MNKKSIEENFNVLYKRLEEEYSSNLFRLKEEKKKESVIKWLLYFFCVIIIIFGFYLLSVIFNNSNMSTPLMIIMIFIFVALMIGIPLFISIYFSKKENNFYIAYKEIVYGAILENVNENWEYYYTEPSNTTDYFDAKFPKETGVVISTGGIKNKSNGNILNSMFFMVYESIPDGPNNINYEGIYFSILNNNSFLDDVYIRSKKKDGAFKGKLPFSKLDTNSNNYNVYSKNLNSIPSELISLIDDFYKLTGLQCDLSISKNKIQMRFDIVTTYPKKEILDRNLLYKMYYELFQINEFIRNLCELLSRKQ